MEARDGVVSVVTPGYGRDELGFDSWQRQEFFSSDCPDRLWNSPDFMISGYQEFLRVEVAGV